MCSDDWVAPHMVNGSCFTFIRGRGAADVASLLGLSWDQRYTTTDPRHLAEDPADPPTRLAAIGEWVCISELSPTRRRGSELLLPLSEKRDAICAVFTATIDILKYARAGDLVSGVDLIVTHIRYGTEENLFEPALAAIETSPTPLSAPARAALIMSMIFGLELTRDMLEDRAVMIPG